jgi:hypothetical protein
MSTPETTTQKRATSSGDGPSRCLSPGSGGEPLKKRRSPETVPPENLKTVISSVLQLDFDEIDLPDPNANVSPDAFFLQLVKAQYGISLQVQPALSLESFFAEVSEEQMAAYNIQVVGAVRNNDLELLKKLHSEGQLLNCSNRFGEALLNMACRRGFESIVEYLLSRPGVDVRICDDSGRTPLHDACWHPSPQLNICKWILERDPAMFLITDRRGCTAFQYARPQHWGVWRKFLFENREYLEPLTKPEILSRLVKL